jgi:hypothetical protein
MAGNILKEVFRLPNLTFITQSLSNEARLEYEQGLIRLFFTFIVFTYLLVSDLVNPLGSTHAIAYAGGGIRPLLVADPVFISLRQTRLEAT